VGFDADNLDKILEITEELNLNFTIFAKTADNDKRFNCVGHHF
jgi:hypothetical protein